MNLQSRSIEQTRKTSNIRKCYGPIFLKKKIKFFKNTRLQKRKYIPRLNKYQVFLYPFKFHNFLRFNKAFVLIHVTKSKIRTILFGLLSVMKILLFKYSFPHKSVTFSPGKLINKRKININQKDIIYNTERHDRTKSIFNYISTFDLLQNIEKIYIKNYFIIN
ncbi:hypothetical protein BpHYR1_013620 [Brachionus plicatilis]|uniref:Uncharacterized protein n=1 Tax=Brachionus plicatilis TaxID=10195 RepID=A0A3M7S3I8_BRAPC|nr:hypothetical protein BpHYR1_013620 [Brachionus plicatilis]